MITAPLRHPGLWLALLVVCVLTSCASTPKSSPRLALFDENFYRGYDSSGECTVAGQAFAKTAGGDVKYAAGDSVFLNPVTPYSTEHWDRTVLHGKLLEPPDPRARKYSRIAIADGEGRFKFTGVPAGRYYLVSGISWLAGKQTAQAMLGDEVSLAAGEAKELILQPKIIRNYPGYWVDYRTGERVNKP